LGEDYISAEQISKFLGIKNWSATKVKDVLKMYNNLHPKIIKDMQNTANTGKIS
jgi:hypothetical protein